VKPLWLAAAAVLAVLVAWRWRRLSTERRAIGLGLAAAAGVYGSGVIVIPDIKGLIEDVGRTLGQWTYLLVGGLAFLETGAFVGLVAPGETAILVGGVVAGQGEINVVVLIGIVWFCAVAGDVTSYLLGRRLGREFLVRHGPRVKITEPRLEQVERFFAKHGGPTILIGRFVGLVRALAPFVAGASKMPFRRFLPYDIVGAGLWGTTFVLLGYIFWRSFDQVATFASQGAFALGTVIVIVVGGVAAYRYFRVPANRRKVEAWFEAHERTPVLGAVIRGGARVWRRGLVPLWRRAMPALRFAWNRLTPGELGLELTTLLAVALVGWFLFGATASLLETGTVTGPDGDALSTARQLADATATGIVKVVTFFGATDVVAAGLLAAVIFLAAKGRPAEAATLVAGGLITFAAVQIAKAAEGRLRPPAALVEAAGSSFPSGHAAYSVAYVAAAVATAPLLRGLIGRTALVGAAIGVSAAIGLSRVYLQVHYLSDVVAGWALGAAVFASCGIVALVVTHLRNNGGAPAPDPGTAESLPP
jgi:membrane protein DedA with SNARE-associated domain/membrane-associated phospholipid phosphatase